MSAGNIGQQIINGTYGLDNRPPTAYEELKAWCEKHLSKENYKVVPESRSYCATIYFSEFDDTDAIGMICFTPDGSVANVGAISEDEMIEHIEDYERVETKEFPSYSPPSNSIGGLMVRRMIEMYERQASLKENRG